MEKFIVSARKYRPTSFNDVVGQTSITTTLKNSIRNNHLGHAYLFSGPRGVGKTTCARIFAKTINCSDITGEGEACNRCESCRSFNENRSFSIHELDAASNNSVDDIRNLNDKVRIPPQIGAYSIYIIDEVHMLSQSAFNAFLKTLEEPPAHAIFVLATTEKHKIIPTILSRCQIFDFNRIRAEDAVRYLAGIAEKEEVGYEDDALHVIAMKADGAMRDALSIFDQVVSFSGEKITYRDVIDNLNILDYDYYFKLTSLLLGGDAAASLLLFNDILARGFDARNFINGYASHLRDLMVCKDRATVELLEVGAGIRDRYLEQSAGVPLEFLYDALEICNQADIQIRSSRNQRLTIELALVKMSRLEEIQKKKELTERDPVPASPEKESPEKASPEKTSPEKTSPEKTSPEKTSPEKTSPEKPEEKSNGSSRIIRSPSISIRDSIRGASGDKTGKAEGKETGEKDPAGEEESGSEEVLQADPDRILKTWEIYAASVEKSRPRTYSTLTSNKPVIRPDGTILLRLNSEAQLDHFIRVIKPELIRFIEEKTGDRVPDIMTEVTETGENGRKIYTDQDKFDYLMGRNPELGALKSRLGLDFDD